MAGKDRNKAEYDDDEDDEDYVDPMDNNDEDQRQHENDDDVVQDRPRLSAKKRKAVDDAFEELFGYAYGTRFALPTLKKAKRQSRKERILVEMFGPTAAAKLLSTSTLDETQKRTYVLPPLEQSKKTVSQVVKRFAGADITIQAPVTAATAATAATKEKKQPETTATSGKKRGLDHVLHQLQGPSKISTVAKTSADWDKFKDDKGLEEELEKKAKGKDAYLVKKDFLDRVDHRRFEHERAQRDKERAARMK